jgi:UDP-3-O-[3-hydroxymyristoyl] N-acetylglucosamine deacetylase
VIARRLRDAVEVAGTSLHGGLPARVVLRPAPWGSGGAFVRDGAEIPADLAHARAEPGATVLASERTHVRVVEHLLAALDALGVTDWRAEVDGPELPAGDGSALAFVAAIDRAGREDGPALPAVADPSPREVSAHGGVARLGPGDEVSVSVDFPDGPRGALRIRRSEAAFRAEVAWARTFVLAREVEALRAAGRGRGATDENTVVWPHARMRAPDECVRHKLLDAWGDLALRGPGRAAFHVVRGSHRLHLAALRPAG